MSKGKPIEALIKKTSSLRSKIKSGISALDRNHHAHIDSAIRHEFVESVDIDEFFREAFPNDHRWDYLLGHIDELEAISKMPHEDYDASEVEKPEIV